ncbi:hypothetical protein BAU15_07530 [Enterococcus sp. JM4C]|uniref:pilin N-terminal domain-containing protein n=1 Tax=Candidatus Enterococcus huntleyi TaxID=1857217 RepID=UPI00137ADEC3|nr:pilin N-terminal domain-containing protein [Enterococcus sp. JM4C]KAF1297553.1 hypothetical protein BAU15_07530 [Enterococcus sp. JM4C]
MKKRIYCLLALLFTGVGFSAIPAHATETAGHGITIQKYKLDSATNVANFPQDGSKAESLTDDKGQALAPLSGITYEVVRVTPLTGGTGFQIVEGTEAFSAEITTDSNGLAQVSGLAQGMYRVVEKPKDGLLKEVMEPVILELPLPQPGGKAALSEVYLYPKSSVASNTGGKDGPKDPTKNPVTRLPQTSGNIGNTHPFVWMSTVIFVMGVVGLFSMKRKTPR